MPTMPRCPAASWAATSAATFGWRRWSLPLLPWLASMTSRSRQPGRPEQRQRPGHRLGVVVRAARAAAQHQVAVGVAGVCMIAGVPETSMPGKTCGTAAARIASTAAWRRCRRGGSSCRSAWTGRRRAAGAPGSPTVRAPIAPQATVSAMYCGVIGSRNSQPTGSPSRDHVEQQRAGGAQAGVHVAAAVQRRIVDQALPADRGARLLEVDPHDDQQVVGEPVGGLAQAARVLQRRPPGRAPSTDRRPPAAGRRRGPAPGRPHVGRPARPRRAAASRGSSCRSRAGVVSGTTRSIRWSLTRRCPGSARCPGSSRWESFRRPCPGPVPGSSRLLVNRRAGSSRLLPGRLETW